MRRTTWLCSIVCCLFLFSIAFAADEPQVYRYKENKKVRVQGEEHVVLLVEAPRGGHPGRLVVPNEDGKPKKDLMSAVDGLSAGSLIQATTQNEKGAPMLQTVASYSTKPGEDTPNGYVFIESKPAKEGSKDQAVVLSKLGEKTTVAVPGDADASVTDVVQKLKKQDPVWVDLSPGRQPTLLAILPYEEPKTGKLLKVAPADVEGHKGFEAQIDDNGKITHALIPGKMHNKVWVTDQRVLSSARRLRAGSEIRYRVQEVSGTTWLREIQPPPKQETAQSRNRDNGSVTDKHGLPNPRKTGGPVQLPPIGITPGGF